MHAVLGELKQASRSLRRTPQSSVVVILTLALGLTATTIVFSAFDAVWLAPLPLGAEAEVVVVTERSGAGAGERVTAGTFNGLRQQSAVIASVAAAAANPLTVSTGQGLVVLPGASVTENFFDVLQVEPVAGRTFRQTDRPAPGLGMVVIDEDAWRTYLGADPGVIGQTIVLGNTPHEVMGIVPSSLSGLAGGARLWTLSRGELPAVRVPGAGPVDSLAGLERFRLTDSLRYLYAVGRLDQNASLGAAKGFVASWSKMQWPGTERQLDVQSVRQHLVGAGLPTVLQVLCAAGVLLLVTCVSVANVLYTRSATRLHDLELRTLLGASKLRLVRQLLFEACLLSVAGGALAIVLTFWSVGTLAAYVPAALPRVAEISVSFRVLAFALLATLLTAALVACPQALAIGLGRSGRAGRGRGRRTNEVQLARRNRPERGTLALVVLQIAFAVVLACGAVLTGASMINVLAVELGYQPENLLIVRGGGAGTAPWRPVELADAVERLQNMPSVVSVATATDGPTEKVAPSVPVRAERNRAAPAVLAGWHVVSESYFQTLGIQFVRGRGCTTEDRASSSPVAIVNEAAAKQLGLTAEAVGQRIALESRGSVEPSWVLVVGVAADARLRDAVEPPQPDLFYCAGQNPQVQQALLVRVSDATDETLRQIRSTILTSGTERSLRSIVAVDTAVASQRATVRVSSVVFASFAALALFLAALALYGVLSASLARRRREIAVRAALGATRTHLIVQAVWPLVAIAMAGVAIGLGSAMLLQRYLSNLLFGVAGLNAQMLSQIAALFVAVAVVAALPAAMLSISPRIVECLKEQ